MGGLNSCCIICGQNDLSTVSLLYEAIVTSALNHQTLFEKFGTVCSDRSERVSNPEAHQQSKLWSFHFILTDNKIDNKAQVQLRQVGLHCINQETRRTLVRCLHQPHVA